GVAGWGGSVRYGERMEIHSGRVDMEDGSMIELLNMDCMEYMRGLPDKAFDMAIVDPPYGIDINSSGRLGHYGGKGKNWDEKTPDSEYFRELFRVSANQIVWGANYFNMPPTRCFLIW